MTPHEPFLQAIIENPDDDVHRLVYADWLEEQRQPERAQFIRLQCELAKLPEGDPRRTILEAQEKESLGKYEEEWLRPLREQINHWVFYRGMLGVGVDVELFLAHAPTLVHSPWVHYIDIGDHAVGRAKIEALVASPFLSRVTILNLAGWYCYDDPAVLVDDEQATMLAACPHVAGLTGLNLRCNQLRDAGVEALVQSPHLRSLEQLDLRANLLTDAGMQSLATSPLLGRLRILDLAYNDGRITDAGWMTLAAAADLTHLRWLCLAGNPMSETTTAAFQARLGDRVVV
jgi:uncharacterized protein (TIGR02996 family)